MRSFLFKIADHLARNKLLRHAVFLTAAIFAIWIGGYHFGTFDQVIHIPFLKKFADPSLFPTDPFLNLRKEHYSYFWLLLIPAYRAGILEPTMFVVQILATYGLFWMIWELSKTLFYNNLANLISICLLIFPHMGMPGFQFIEFSLLNRSFVLPFVLGAIVLYLRRHYLIAFLVLGLMVNIHILYAVFVVVILTFDSLMRVHEIGWRSIVKGLVLFTLGALPVLAWRAGGAPLDLQVRPDVLKLISSGLLAGVYYAYLPFPHIWINTLHGFATLAFFLLGRRMRLSEHNRIFTRFVFAIGIVLLLQLVTTYWLPVTLILQFQILRIGFFLMVIGYVYFAGYLAAQFQQGNLQGLAGGLVIFSFITYVSPLMPLIFLALYRWLAKSLWRQWSGAALILLIQIVIVYAGSTMGIWSPGFHLYEPETTWTQTQDWARANTPKDALFITPPHIFSHYIPDWRTFSERGTLTTLVEIFEFPHPGYFPSWQEKFEAIAPGAVSQFNGNYFDTFKITREAYYSLEPADYMRAARAYNVRYLVVEKPHLQPFPIVYQNEGFVIYDLQKQINSEIFFH